MGFGSDIANAGARGNKNFTRNGNEYAADGSGRRLTALNPAGAAYPQMEVIGFPKYDALVAAQKDYNGFVTAHLRRGDIVEPWMGQKAYDNGPKDHFAELDDGTWVRSDAAGKPDLELRDRKPDNSGMIDGGNYSGMGSNQSQPSATAITTAPASPIRVAFFDHGKPIAGYPQSQLHATTQGLFGGSTAVYKFMVPAGSPPNGKVQLDMLQVGSAGNPMDSHVFVNDVEVLHWNPADSGNAPGFVYSTDGSPAPLQFKAEDNVRMEFTPTGNVANDLGLEHRVY